MKIRTFMIVIALLPLQAANAVINLEEFGAFSIATWGDCAAPCAVGDINLVNILPAIGGAGVLSATQTLTEVDLGGAGTLTANTSILGGLSTPLLGAEATSNAGRFVLAQAVAAQGYTVVSGGNGQVINFQVNLTGTVTNSGGDGTGLTAFVGVKKVTILGEFTIVDALILSLLDPDRVEIGQTTNGLVNEVGNASIMVDEGDQFYMWALLGAAAGDANAASSLTTLSIDITSGGGSLAAAGVPLPAPVILLVSALTLLRVRVRS
ncbi:MAG: hypothetical protein O7B81_11825 [Gammaproteobacteria bacterium]|nr:hypothetical protein [Gammaproteobacteria bacterium]